MSTEHTPPTAANRALDVLMKAWDSWADHGRWASPASRECRRIGVERDHRATIAKLAAAGLLPSDTPRAGLDVADELQNLASCVRRGVAVSAAELERLACAARSRGGLVARSDDSTDTLIAARQLAAAVEACKRQSVAEDDGNYGVEGVPFDNAVRLAAALRAALASQPKGE